MIRGGAMGPQRQAGLVRGGGSSDSGARERKTSLTSHGGTHYDLVGQGSLAGLYCIHTTCETDVYQRSAALLYTFAVPEPTTLTLLFGGVVALMAVGSATKD
jgi:hypothetical protein